MLLNNKNVPFTEEQRPDANNGNIIKSEQEDFD